MKFQVLGSKGAVGLALMGMLICMACNGEDEAALPDKDSGTSPDNCGPGSSDKNCGVTDGGVDAESTPQEVPLGETDFISADGYQGEETALDTSGVMDASVVNESVAMGDEETDRTVEEGDIYRVLGDDQILNLNSYQGLQIIDFKNVKEPEIIGRYQVTGSPVELYTVDDRAVVLLNNWRGYYGARKDMAIYSREGGLVLIVDISDRMSPKLVDQAFVNGSIKTSRLTKGDEQTALYIAADYYGELENDQGELEWDSRTLVQSFDVSGDTIKKRTELDLGGYVTDIQATSEALLVARNNWDSDNSYSTVSLVDISNPDGTMVQGDEVQVRGVVSSKYNMNLYNGILRIVSGRNWNEEELPNHLQTYDAGDFANLKEIDYCSFGEGEDLFATLFVENKAFFVTYFRTDPFHAFWVGDDGTCEERSEFIVSGWNDFFQPVLDRQRLIGIGVNDEDGDSTMSVSLYDITDLSNSEPLLDREEVDLESSWSEARWDDRAFTVLEGALQEDAADGETGLVLLPFEGYNSGEDQYIAAVQIFTFSDTSLTKRGVMDHGSEVRRSFLGNPQVTANLSEAELSLFDHTKPDSPTELGRVVLAPNYTQVLTYGDYLVRKSDPNDSYYYWYSDPRQLKAVVEIISRTDDIHTAEVLAKLEVPSSAYLVKADKQLISIYGQVTDSEDEPVTYRTTIDVYDLTDPTSPQHQATLTSDRIKPTGFDGFYYYDDMFLMDDCWDCFGSSSYSNRNLRVIDGALVFIVPESQRELLGSERVCYHYPLEDPCWFEDSDQACEEYYTGAVTCRSLNGEPQICTGHIGRCEVDSDQQLECQKIDPETIETTGECRTEQRYRYWNAYTLQVLSLKGQTPKLSDPIELPRQDEAVSIIAGSDSVYYTYKEPFENQGDPRPYVRYYFRQIDLSTPDDPEIGDPINIPGELLSVDGETLYTQDIIWGSTSAETAINKLELQDGLATRQAVYRFSDRYVDKVQLDAEGNVLVSHQPIWDPYDYLQEEEEEMNILTVLKADDLTELSEIEVDAWAELYGAQQNRALFDVPGGLLILNLVDPQAPFPQAYFPTRGWPDEVLFEGDEILFAAGRYGIYRFDADTFNLLPLSLMTQ